MSLDQGCLLGSFDTHHCGEKDQQCLLRNSGGRFSRRYKHREKESEKHGQSDRELSTGNRKKKPSLAVVERKIRC